MQIQQLFGGVIGAIVLVLVLIWAVMWTLFPFIVSRKLDQVIHRLKRIETEVERTATNTRPPVAPGEKSAVRDTPVMRR
jgi:hypothetical protein